MANKNKNWQPSNLSAAKPINSAGLSVLEFQDNKGEWHNFDILVTSKKIIFGGTANCGFLESGYIIREDYDSLDETLQELLADLETYYNDGKEFVSRIICNQRM